MKEINVLFHVKPLKRFDQKGESLTRKEKKGEEKGYIMCIRKTGKEGKSMNYEKRVCVLKQVRQGFSADGNGLSGVVTAEKTGDRLTFCVKTVGLAPVKEGRYLVAVWVNGRIFHGELPSGNVLTLNGGESLKNGFALLLCFYRGDYFPVAFGSCGMAPMECGTLLNSFRGEKIAPERKDEKKEEKSSVKLTRTLPKEEQAVSKGARARKREDDGESDEIYGRERDECEKSDETRGFMREKRAESEIKRKKCAEPDLKRAERAEAEAWGERPSAYDESDRRGEYGKGERGKKRKEDGAEKEEEEENGERKPLTVPQSPFLPPSAPAPNVPFAPGITLPDPPEKKYDDEAIAETDYFSRFREAVEDEGFASCGEEEERAWCEADEDEADRHGTYYETVRDRLSKTFALHPKDRRLNGVFPCSEWVEVEGGVMGVIYHNGLPQYLCVGVEKESIPPEREEDFTFVPYPFSEEGVYIVFQSAKSGEVIRFPRLTAEKE